MSWWYVNALETFKVCRIAVIPFWHLCWLHVNWCIALTLVLNRHRQFFLSNVLSLMRFMMLWCLDMILGAVLVANGSPWGTWQSDLSSHRANTEILELVSGYQMRKKIRHPIYRIVLYTRVGNCTKVDPWFSLYSLVCLWQSILDRNIRPRVPEEPFPHSIASVFLQRTHSILVTEGEPVGPANLDSFCLFRRILVASGLVV